MDEVREIAEMNAALATEIARRFPDPQIAEETQRDRSDRLAGFIQEGQQLRERSKERPLPIQDHNDWVDRMAAYLRSTLGEAYEVRLSDFSGMTFYDSGSGESKFLKSIDGRLRRLHEFIREINRT